MCGLSREFWELKSIHLKVLYGQTTLGHFFILVTHCSFSTNNMVSPTQNSMLTFMSLAITFLTLLKAFLMLLSITILWVRGYYTSLSYSLLNVEPVTNHPILILFTSFSNQPQWPSHFFCQKVACSHPSIHVAWRIIFLLDLSRSEFAYFSPEFISVFFFFHCCHSQHSMLLLPTYRFLYSLCFPNNLVIILPYIHCGFFIH